MISQHVNDHQDKTVAGNRETTLEIEVQKLQEKLSQAEKQAERYKTERNKVVKLVRDGMIKNQNK